MTLRRVVAALGEDPSNGITVQEAITETVHRGGVHPKELASRLNRTHRYVLDVADEMRPKKLKADEVDLLVMATGNTLVLDVLERHVGRVAYSLPPAEQTTCESLKAGAAVLKECSDVVTTFAASCSDHTLTHDEAAALEREGEQAVRAVLALLAFVRAHRAARPRRLS